jgi:hypothetical protein
MCVHTTRQGLSESPYMTFRLKKKYFFISEVKLIRAKELRECEMNFIIIHVHLLNAELIYFAKKHSFLWWHTYFMSQIKANYPT